MAEISSFDFARLAALKQYSDLEAELCLVLRYALEADHDAAVSVFYQVANTRARYAIISRLLGRRQEGVYRKAWDRIERWLIPCDSSRNQFVHWSEDSVIHVTVKSPEPPLQIDSLEQHPVLRNPAGATRSRSHYETDIWKSRDQMRLMLHIVNRLGLTLDDPQRWPWTDIFQQPISDRTPEEFLTRLNDKGSPARLPPYERKLLPRLPDRHVPPDSFLSPE